MADERITANSGRDYPGCVYDVTSKSTGVRLFPRTSDFFLYGISRNLLRRQFESEEDAESIIFCEGEAEDLTTGTSILEDLARRENIEAVRQAILSLPPIYREVLVLCDLQEFSYEQAAAALGCPIGTVRSRLHRGRTALCSKLQNRCYA